MERPFVPIVTLVQVEGYERPPPSNRPVASGVYPEHGRSGGERPIQ